MAPTARAEEGEQAEEGELAEETTTTTPLHVQQQGGDLTVLQLFPFVPDVDTQIATQPAQPT